MTPSFVRRPIVREKPWGTEEIWASTHHSVGKLLTIRAGHRLSRKYHTVKNHTIRILSGILTIEIGPRSMGGAIEYLKLHPGDAYFVGANVIHRFCAEDGEVQLAEVSSQGSSDSVRLEDDYRRIESLPEPAPQSEK